MLRPNNHAKPILLVLLFVAFTAIFLYGNVITQKGSVLDNAILNEDDSYRQMDIHVKALKKDGLNAGEFIPIIMEFPRGIQARSDLEKIFAFDQAIKQNLPDLGVMSLVEAVDYHDNGVKLANNKYIDVSLLQDPHLDIEQWKNSIRRNEGVYGLLVGRNFDYAVFAIYLPQDYDEIFTYRRVAQ